MILYAYLPLEWLSKGEKVSHFGKVIQEANGRVHIYRGSIALGGVGNPKKRASL